MKKTIPVPLSILSIPILLAAPSVPLLFLSHWTPELVPGISLRPSRRSV